MQNKLNHYVYKIYNIETKEYYIGVRSCKCTIEKDKYMGSSQIWTKEYIKENKDILIKTILGFYETRDIANLKEVEFLKENQNNPLCVNILYDVTPSAFGKKQTEEHINKRKRSGEANGFFGKHHTDETKQIISDKLKGRVMSDETKEKIGKFHKNKIVSDETRKKISNSRKKIRKITNIKTGEVFIIDITSFCKEYNLNASSMRKAASIGCIYNKQFKIEELDAAFDSNINRTLGEHGESLEVDNPVGSLGSV